MKKLFSLFLSSTLVLCLLIVSGCDTAPNDNFEISADEANIETVTEEALLEAKLLTQSFEDLTAQSNKNFVYVPAGSVDELSAALVEAGPGGLVILASGAHYESGTVAISARVTLIGEKGAKLIVNTSPRPVVSTMDPALHITDASSVAIWGVEILPEGDTGGTAILAERATNLVVGNSRIAGHQVGVAIDRSDNVRIVKNVFEMSTATNIAAKQGIVVINGTRPLIVSNRITNATVGVFASDKKGRLIKNETYGNFIGILLCKLQQLPAPSGEILSADRSATEWIVSLNNAHSNAWGYLTIDGANKNLIGSSNEAANNSSYDIELAGDTERFGFFSPTSFENKVFVADDEVSVKDCGVNNQVSGGTQVDTNSDPCF